MRPRHVLLSLLLLGCTTVVRAEDWPEFRGPTGQGIVRTGGLPLSWSAERNVVWKQPIPGLGWSSPVVVAGRIYLTTSVPVPDSADEDQSLRALCLEAPTGKVVWDREVFRQQAQTAPRIHTKNSHASPTPVVQGGQVFVHFGHQGTACLDLAGNIVWRNTSLGYKPVHGNGGSPILVDHRLIFSCDGGDQRFVVALGRNTGKVLWKTERQGEAVKKFSFSTPLLIEVEGQRQVVSPGSDQVAAHDPATGREIWGVRTKGYSVIPRPVFGHGLVFICTGYDSPTLIAVRPTGSGDVTDTHVAWTLRKGVPHTPSLVLSGDELYLVSDAGVGSCLDARTGRVHWQERLGGNYSASPVLADGRLYFQSEQGNGTVLRAGRQFEVLSRNPIGERTLASYAAVDGVLFLRSEKHLYRIEQPRTGSTPQTAR